MVTLLFVKRILALIFLLALLIVYWVASSEKQQTIKSLGFDNYVYRSVDVGFEFGYEVLEYTIKENDDPWYDIQTYSEVYMLKVKQEDMQKIWGIIKSSKKWTVQRKGGGGESSGKPPFWYFRSQSFYDGFAYVIRSRVTIQVGDLNRIKISYYGS